MCFLPSIVFSGGYPFYHLLIRLYLYLMIHVYLYLSWGIFEKILERIPFLLKFSRCLRKFFNELPYLLNFLCIFLSSLLFWKNTWTIKLISWLSKDEETASLELLTVCYIFLLASTIFFADRIYHQIPLFLCSISDLFILGECWICYFCSLSIKFPIISLCASRFLTCALTLLQLFSVSLFGDN